MSEFEIEYQKDRNISINITCLKCQEEFSTELDNYSEENLPFSSDDTLYCIDCDTPYNYTIKIDLNKFGIIFKENNIFGYLEYSETNNLEPDEYNTETTTSDSENFYSLQIDRLKKLLDVDTKEYLVKQSLNRLVFSGVITSLETYLNEVFMAVVFNSDYTLEKFVSHYEPYKKEQFSLNEIFSKRNSISCRVREDIDNLIYHNVSKLIRIFNIFDFELNNFNKIDSIAKSVQKRHNLVHRSGLGKYNNFQEVTDIEILSLIDNVNSFVEYINTKIEEECFLPHYLKGDFNF